MSAGSRVIVVWGNNLEYEIDTGLRGAEFVSANGFVIPFPNVEDLIDCLRLVIRMVEREQGEDV